ncbi:MAG TPA: flagellar basal body rod protein FlgC [Longimicrobiaceae bacterium]|nr:flagellar basal body rod protein FlgC [Longimicrobiaceae bacterium]
MPTGFPPDPYRPIARPMFRTLAISASGLSAQRQRLETIASNVANAETTRTADGTPYRRRFVQMEAGAVQAQPYAVDVNGQPSLFRLPSGAPLDPAHGVRVTAIAEDMSEGPLVYEPGHPDANEAGYVRYPNVRITDELINLMDARRVYEANATVFQSAKQMLRRSLDI